jgi:hypothetical protein
MQRLLTEFEKAEIIEREWAKARARNPKVVMRVTVHDETDEGVGGRRIARIDQSHG